MLSLVLGLLSGGATLIVLNPRLAVSAHLQGLLNALFLIAVGLLWDRLVLSPRLRTVVVPLLLEGTYGNWAMTLLGSVWGTKNLTPIAGAGYVAAPWQETVVAGGLAVAIGSMLVAAVILSWGLRRDPST